MTTFNEITINFKMLLPLLSDTGITSSRDAAEIYRRYCSEKIHYKEEFFIMLLNTANKPLGICKISEGGLSSTTVDVRNIFQTALKANAANVILFHNHPSGNLRPSEADRSITKKIIEAGKVMDIKVLDHVIMTAESYFSFTDEGEM